MHHEIDYKGNKSAAMADFNDWFRADQIALLKAAAPTLTRDQFHMYCSIAGCEGFPVDVAYDEFKGGSSL